MRLMLSNRSAWISLVEIKDDTVKRLWKTLRNGIY